jgi:hypothetical protein
MMLSSGMGVIEKTNEVEIQGNFRFELDYCGHTSSRAVSELPQTRASD